MRKFDLSVSASDGYMQRTLKNEGSVGSDILEKIIATYPEINPYWLLSGEGEMLKINGDLIAVPDSPEFEKDLFELTLLEYLDKPRVQDKIRKLVNDGKGKTHT